ncbi:MAG: hypothetical protein ACRCZF_01410, partial [Gemmataceae bacterium]
MTKSKWLGLVIMGGCLVAGGWTLAQPRPQPLPLVPAQSPPGHYVVTGFKDSAVMVDSTNGKSWVLHLSVQDGTSVWVPVAKIDDLNEGSDWI